VTLLASAGGSLIVRSSQLSPRRRRAFRRLRLRSISALRRAWRSSDTDSGYRVWQFAGAQIGTTERRLAPL
jgi:uncharacterized protein YfiM (DUF2279 family)